MRVARECMQWVHVEVRVYRISEVCKPPAPVRHRSPTRLQLVRGHRHSRTSASRWSRIGRVGHTAPICMCASHRCERNRKVGKPPAPVRHRSPTRSPAVRGHRSHLRLSMVQNRSRRAPTPICEQRPRGAKCRGPVNACPVAPSLSAALADRAPARPRTADPVYRWSKIGRVAPPRQYASNDRGGRNAKVR